MSRSSRENQKSYTGVYHIILRGINSQDIFFDDMDREKFIKEIKNTKEIYNYKLYAYVLMSNHIHILIQDQNNSISKIMQSLAIRYAMYFNKKYQRIGHVFYNRFHSKCVEDEEYLLNVHRYIHKNPEKDGLGKMDKYRWSSYQEYITKKDVTDTEFILSIFNNNKKKAIQIWKQYHQVTLNNEYDEEYEDKKKLSDNEAIDEIKDRLQINNILEIQKYSVDYKKKIIKELTLINGITKKQLARILGINERAIYRAISGK